ncbi:MAG: hypothetical protein GF317_01225 [Candidatus Lokiarchaeota archaeon]|nr:hypothetical protein [Candidatus Lokiarchaeota archaeon]MBD3198576.1 hypothetical protein [Candidatus Lokiarchaeota archaeon]
MEKEGFIGKYKVINWIKGVIFIILGILNNRFDVGYHWFLDNLIFGPIIYIFIIISGMLIALDLRSDNGDRGEKSNKKLTIKNLAYIFFLIAYGINCVYVFYFQRNIIILIVLGGVGIIWYILSLFGKDWEKRSLLVTLIVSFTVAFGLIFGALLNDISIPTWSYFFFSAIFTLQFSKDIIKSCEKGISRTENEKYGNFCDIFTAKKTQRIALALQIIAILSLTLPLILGVYNGFLYLITGLIVIILVAISAILNLIYDFEEKYSGKVFVLLKIGMFFSIIAIFFASI